MLFLGEGGVLENTEPFSAFSVKKVRRCSSNLRGTCACKFTTNKFFEIWHSEKNKDSTGYYRKKLT